MKLLAFIKQNKAIVLALVIVLLSFGLLAFPGQFAHYGVDGYQNGHYTFKYNLNGYQWMFNTVENISGNKIGKAVPQGIAAFVMLVLCVPGLLFSKKSSFVALLTSLALITISVLYFTISAAGLKAYPFEQGKDHAYWLILWVPYVIGGLVVIAGLLMSYRTFMVMKNEVKSPSQSKSQYSYLKNK